MRICIPTQSDTLSDARICPHFGKAEYHLVLENQEEVARHNRDDRPSEGCAPIDWILQQGVTHVVCLGIGDGAYRRLQAGGVTVLHAGKHRWIRDAARAACDQELEPFQPRHLCDHTHAHSHD
jgi:predicted Fe-Mo cluster-binding NifX family protein